MTIVQPAYRAPSPPETLVLQGLSGTPRRPLAMINSEIFEANEEKPARVGQRTVVFRCLEIRTQSVVVKLPETDAPIELFIQPR